MKKILTFLFAFAAINLFAQRTITGIVTDEKGETIVGAAVRILGTTVGTVTDLDGKYSLRVDEKSKFLSFSFAGMTSINAEIGSVNTIHSVLKTTTLPTFEVIGYGTYKCCRGCFASVIYWTIPRAVYTTQTEQSTLTLNILGNPFKDRFIVQVNSEEAANAVVSLHSMNGKLVKSFETSLLKGDNTVEINDLEQLIVGTYAVSVSLLEQDNKPKITDKLTTVDLPERFYNKILSAHPDLKRHPFKEAIRLSKEQFALVLEAHKLKENIGKVRKIILDINPEFDSWDLDDEMADNDDLNEDELLLKTYKPELQQLLIEYQSLMTNPLFENEKTTKEYSLDDFETHYYNPLSSLLLVKRDVVVKKRVYSKMVVKM